MSVLIIQIIGKKLSNVGKPLSVSVILIYFPVFQGKPCIILASYALFYGDMEED